jgi:hypothetical protein
LLWIIGAPKCGTSALFDLLGRHPDIEPSTPKETQFFLDAEYPIHGHMPRSSDADPKTYRSYWPSSRARWKLDGSPDYLYQSKIFENPPLCRPALSIVLLRPPWERVYSVFQFARLNRFAIRQEASFDQFVTASLDSARRPDTGSWTVDHAVEQSSYLPHLERWDERSWPLFPMLSSEINDTEVVRHLLHHLDVTEVALGDVESNRTAPKRSQELHRIAVRANRAVPRRARAVARTIYRKINPSLPAEPVSDRDQHALELLEAHFRDEWIETRRWVDAKRRGWGHPTAVMSPEKPDSPS